MIVPVAQRVLRVGLIVYAVTAIPLFVVANPLGGMFGRVAEAFAPAVVLVLSAAYRRRWLAALVVPLLIWQASPALALLSTGVRDPSSNTSYFQPLLHQLARGDTIGRLEIPFTLNHWEAALVAPQVPLARGWERQLDVVDNPIFYRASPITASSYHNWLIDSGITWIALPDVKLDYSARTEAAVLKAKPGYLHEIWHDTHWRLWKVTDSPGIASGTARVVSLKPDRFVLNAAAPGTTTVRLRYTRTWTVTTGQACISATRDHWTQVDTAGPGPVAITASLTHHETDRCRDHEAD